MLNPKAVPIPIIQHNNDINTADFFLDKNPSSAKYATPGSNIEIEELNAAIDNRIKNKGPINCPNSI